MDNARSPLQIPVERQISVEDVDNTIDFCNNTTELRTPNNSRCQTAGRLCRNTVEQAKCYKSGTATRTAWRLNATTSLSRRLVVGEKKCTCKCKLGVVSRPLGKAKD